MTAQVSITADIPLIEVERTQQANTISTQQVENLPNAGRLPELCYTLPAWETQRPRASFRSHTGFQSSGFSIGAATGVTISSQLTWRK